MQQQHARRRRRLRALASHVAADADRVAQLQREWRESRERTAAIERELADVHNATFAPDDQEKVAPMAGVTVLEVANWAATPAAGAILADLGAEVIKVEAIEGDSMRFALAQPKILNPETEKNFSSGETIDPEFNFANRGKKSVCINVGDPEGVAIVHRLAARCDVFLTNLLPPRLRQFSLTYDAIKAVNPRAVYASMTPYGSSGPQSELTGFDFTAFCESAAPPPRLAPRARKQVNALLLTLTRAASLARDGRSCPGRSHGLDGRPRRQAHACWE